jgi:predicted ArsR family transcriptional regulator
MSVTEQKRPRGRPRPQETIERDRRILEYLRREGPQSRNALAEALGEEKSKVWLALDRLRKDDLVQLCDGVKGVEAVWTTAVGVPCP